MSEVRTFFRHCPACGRRFQIRLVGKKLEDTDRHTWDLKREGVQYRSPGWFRMGGMPTAVSENMPVTVSVEEFQYAYKCHHCGHEWSEKHIEEHQ